MALELSSFSGSGMILTNTSAAPPPPIAALFDLSAPTGRTTARQSGRCFGSETERSRALPTGTATSTFVGPLRRTDTSAAPGRRRNLREKERAAAAEAEAARLRDAAAPPSSRRVLAAAAATALAPSARRMPRPHIPPLWRVSEDSAVHGGGDAGTSTASRIEGEMASRVTARWPKASLCVPSRGEHTGRSTSATARSVSTRAHDTERAAPKPFERVARHDVGLIGATSPMEREVSEALMEIQRMRNRGYR